MAAKVAAIVDAYSTGAELAPHLARLGYACVHVQSSHEVPADFRATFNPVDFVESLVAAENQWDLVLTELATHGPQMVLAGTETGVALADFLTHRLGLAGNDPATSMLRRDKFEMQEALRRAGLASIRQQKAATAGEAARISRDFASWPLVVKPLESAGADGVAFCGNEAEVREAAARILGTRSRLGMPNRGVLLQERLAGQQYFVNAVSIDGLHKFTEIWIDHKSHVPGAALICDKEELLPFRGEAQDRIVPYVASVLTVLGVRNGPSHSELMLTERGPILIETAARMQGTILHEAVVTATGASHVTRTVERYVYPERFRRGVSAAYTLEAALYCVTLQSRLEGVVVENRVRSLVSTLPSFHGLIHTPEPGDRICPTTDLFTNPGIIYLLHPDREQLERDYAQIRAWEAAGALFEVRAA